MLTEIHCDKFHETPIRFKAGLNIVTGDSAATNSIGKSTCLMVIDFVFGGSTLIEHNTDIISELGHHKYYYKILLNGQEDSFCRDTGNPNFVFQCNSDYTPEKTLTIAEYRSILGQNYTNQLERLSFRQIASLFSRIWGKDNLDPKRPLDAHIKAPAKDAINFILNLYQKYDFIAPLEKNLEQDNNQKDALTSAKRQKIIPDISAKQFKENQRIAEEIDAEFINIKDELYKYATNIRLLTSTEVAEIKATKDNLIQARSDVSARLQRIEKSLTNSSYIKSKAFRSIKEYFPEVNVHKIEEVENFHNNISRILKEELKATKTLLTANLDQINEELRLLDVKLEKILKNIDNPAIIVDHVYELSRKRESLKLENTFHEKGIQLTAIIKEQKSKLDDEKNRQLATIAQEINTALASLSDQIYGVGRKSPYLSLTPSNYTFSIHEDTGTGRAYSNLVLFDLAILLTTQIPFIIHDSVLFKNVENYAIASLLAIYSKQDRQVFISIDEIEKYGKPTVELVDQNRVLSLSDKKVLYIKDWRRKAP